MPKRRAALDVVLRYRYPEVIHRFCDEWDVSRTEARLVFADLLRYLWLAQQNKELAPVPIIDKMWHTFLAFTRPYAEFSRRYFGRMLHHVPTTSAEKRAGARLVETAPERARARHERGLQRDVSAVYETLGERVALRWYVVYSDRYSPAFFATKRKPIKVIAAEFPDALLQRARILNKSVYD
jgi:hypothetical protein